MTEPRGTVREGAAERLERDAVLIGCACHEGPEDMTIHGGGLGRECPVCLLVKSHRALRLREPEGRDGWRDINSAPRDGRWILGWWGDDRAETMRWSGREWTHYDGDATFTLPTHWMPISGPVAPPSPTDTREY